MVKYEAKLRKILLQKKSFFIDEIGFLREFNCFGLKLRVSIDFQAGFCILEEFVALLVLVGI